MVAGDAYGQIFITDTNRDHLDSILSRHSCDYKLFEVVHGEISERLTSGQKVVGSDALATKKETEETDV